MISLGFLLILLHVLTRTLVQSSPVAHGGTVEQKSTIRGLGIDEMVLE